MDMMTLHQYKILASQRRVSFCTIIGFVFQIGMSARQESLAEAKCYEGGSGRLFSAHSHSMRKPTGDGCGQVAKRQGVQFCQVINAMIDHWSMSKVLMTASPLQYYFWLQYFSGDKPSWFPISSRSWSFLHYPLVDQIYLKSFTADFTTWPMAIFSNCCQRQLNKNAHLTLFF